MSSKALSRHVHFAPEVVSGSHEPPENFRKGVKRTKIQLVESTKANPAAYAEMQFFLRKGVPFGKWLKNSAFVSPLKSSKDLCKARCQAFFSFAEGSLKVSAGAICYVFAKAFNFIVLKDRMNLHTQWQGLKLSTLALLSPGEAKEKFINSVGDTPKTFYDKKGRSS
ncbi:MAG: hypothetical protein ACM3JI_03225 [Anaerolineae bacterium]